MHYACQYQNIFHRSFFANLVRDGFETTTVLLTFIFLMLCDYYQL